MSENKIYEITRLIQSPDNFREDIHEAINIISNHFRGKYISPIEQEIKICSEECKKAPSKETALLEACRPFVKDSKKLDEFLNLINNLRVVERLINSSVRIAQLEDSSIHDDGIYDVDNNCKINHLNTEDIFNINPIIIVAIILLTM